MINHLDVDLGAPYDGIVERIKGFEEFEEYLGSTNKFCYYGACVLLLLLARAPPTRAARCNTDAAAGLASFARWGASARRGRSGLSAAPAALDAGHQLCGVRGLSDQRRWSIQLQRRRPHIHGHGHQHHACVHQGPLPPARLPSLALLPAALPPRAPPFSRQSGKRAGGQVMGFLSYARLAFSNNWAISLFTVMPLSYNVARAAPAWGRSRRAPSSLGLSVPADPSAAGGFGRAAA